MKKNRDEKSRDTFPLMQIFNSAKLCTVYWPKKGYETEVSGNGNHKIPKSNIVSFDYTLESTSLT
jgi:hypothetical protein